MPAELSLILHIDALIGASISRALAIALATIRQGMSASVEFPIQQ